MFPQILLASIFGSVCALAGGALLLWREKFAKKISLMLVSFAVGSMTGAAFLELIPEAIHESGLDYESVAPFILVGIFAIFLFEKVVHWYHVHEEGGDHAHEHDERQHDHQRVTSAVLFGDSLHNFIDGITIALSWSVSAEVGLATTVAIFFHEVPQEIGDFGVLIHLGYSRAKVWAYNFWTALMTPAGATIGYFLLPYIEPYTPYFLAFAAGSFLYIAISDLLPELHHHKAHKKDFLHLACIALGVLSIFAVGLVLPEH